MNELLHRYGGHYVGYEALWMSRDLYLNVWRDNVINENKEAASGVLVNHVRGNCTSKLVSIQE